MSVVASGKGLCPYCGKELDAAEFYLHISTCPKRTRGVRVKHV
jgi:hypothetical protein